MTTPEPSLWPGTPACYNWLSLDRRGRWRLQEALVSHQGLIDFINRNYGPDGLGNWCVENGPQGVFVSLEYTPWVLHLTGEGKLQTHTGAEVDPVLEVFLDDAGSLLLLTKQGIGLLDDRDLPAFLADCGLENGTPAAEEDFLAIMGGKIGQCVRWRGLPLRPIRQDEVPRRFGFQPQPMP